jgi:tetratricopeptide (TPR) repeat protein
MVAPAISRGLYSGCARRSFEDSVLLKRPIQFILILILLIGFCQAAFAQESLDAKGWFEKGNELSREGKFADAAQAYQQSVQLNDQSPVAYYNLGIALKKILQFDQALIAFEKTVALEPTHYDGWLSLGNIYNRLERWEDAIGALNQVVHRRQNDAEAHGNLGWALYNYRAGPPFKYLVIINLRRATDLFEEQNLPQAAKATREVLQEAKAKFSFN